MASLVVAGDVSGSVTLSAPSAAGSTVITLPTTSGTMVVTGGAQTVQFAAGSAASPSITFTGDTNTGIFSPTADTIAFSEGGVESMRIDSSGNVGIGSTSPLSKLEVVGGQFRVANTSTAAVCIISTDSTSTNGVTVESSYYGGAGYGPMKFNTGGSERMRIDSSGNLLVAITATQNISGVNTDHTFAGTTSTGRWVCGFINSSASSPYGLAVNYTGSAPNATGNQFLFCRDTGGTRFEVRSNGGIANYSANDVNLSDEREKTNIQLAGSYLDKICAIPIKKFKYIDQNRETDDGLTLGVIAQDVQAVAPELVMESNWAGKDEPEKMRLSIYQTDLQYALMKAIQELNAKVEAQAAEIAALKGAN